MPASRKQIEANRRNSQKSTGPVTEEGKERSSHNALKHGMYSEDVLLYHEDFEGYEKFRAQLFHDNETKTAIEMILQEQILQSYFMSRRAIFMMADADNAAVHGGKATAFTYPALMKMKLQNDRIVQKAIEILEEIRKTRAKEAPAEPKPDSGKKLPKIDFVPPQYPIAPDWKREVPFYLR